MDCGSVVHRRLMPLRRTPTRLPALTCQTRASRESIMFVSGGIIRVLIRGKSLLGERGVTMQGWKTILAGSEIFPFNATQC